MLRDLEQKLEQLMGLTAEMLPVVKVGGVYVSVPAQSAQSVHSDLNPSEKNHMYTDMYTGWSVGPFLYFL